jgi:hypothetical protein
MVLRDPEHNAAGVVAVGAEQPVHPSPLTLGWQLKRKVTETQRPIKASIRNCRRSAQMNK